MNSPDQQGQQSKREKVAIVGLGGTGSHILDFLSRSEVDEIHLFDDDMVSEDTLDRAPGANFGLGDISTEARKATFYAARYTRARPDVTGFDELINEGNVSRLADYSSVFVSIDGNRIKRRILEVCKASGATLIIVGMAAMRGSSSQLFGILQVTSCGPSDYAHARRKSTSR